MRKTSFVLGAALAALAPSAHATAGTCVALADVAGDHRLPPAPQAAPLAPYTAGIDLLAVDAVADSDTVTVTFTAAGAPDPAAVTNYEYEYRFEDAAGLYKLNAGLDGGAHLPLSGVYELVIDKKGVETGGDVGGIAGGEAGTTGGDRVTVDGWVDLAANQVTIQAPATAFGLASFPAGTAWTTAGAGTGWGVAGTRGYYADTVPSAPGSALVAGDGTCA